MFALVLIIKLIYMSTSEAVLLTIIIALLVIFSPVLNALTLYIKSKIVKLKIRHRIKRAMMIVSEIIGLDHSVDH